ncbi:ribonuclease HII [Gryllotalpicola sp.]|uniref:ribonuclease HII n=1 Tax=Gryllotalpicola sp. TaxID=1932787 RepID=UPI002619BA67|nr:ribonuclease HII [Gryllotalpicola sp.]
MIVPDFALEAELLRRFPVVIGCDEVGRGAIAGPVVVGMTVVDSGVGPFPAGLRDSKLLTAKARERLEPACRRWARHSAVGEASAAEVDALGIVAALGLAGSRALGTLHASGAAVGAAVVLLDGAHDWLTAAIAGAVPVTARVKADQTCAAVAAASVIAKVHRDSLMTALHDAAPHYGWAGNKGYGAAAHFEAIAAHGPSDQHRLTWLHSA